MRCTIILACSLVDPTLAFGAVPACTDMDSPSFSALTNELAAEVGLFSPGEWSTVPRLCGICVCGRGGALTQHLAKLHPLSLAYLGEYPTCASAVGVCFVAAIASAAAANTADCPNAVRALTFAPCFNKTWSIGMSPD